MEHQIEIIGGHIVIRIRQTVGIRKMRPCCTDLYSLFIHHLHKTLDGSAHVDRDSICRVVSRWDQKAVKKLLQCQLVSGNDSRHGGTALRDHRLLGNRHHIIKIPIF